MADIITRLVLKSDDWGKNLDKAKGSVGSFEKKISDMSGKAGAGILKFAGALGVAVTASEGLNQVMNSSQTIGDEYNRTLDGLKGAVDQFFYSIGSGDWTPFFNGLKETIQLARDAYTAMDQLGNTKMSYSYFTARNQATVQEQIAILKDKNSTEQQKKVAKEILDKTIADQKEIVEQYQRRSNEAMQAMVKAAIGFDGVDVSGIDIDKVLRLDVSALGDSQKADFSKQYEEFEKEFARIKNKYTTRETVGYGFNAHVVSNTDMDSVRKEMGPLVAKYQDAIKYNAILVKKSDDWLQNLIGVSTESDNAKRNLAGMEKAANRASQSERETKGTGTSAEKKQKKETVTMEMIAQVNSNIQYDTPLGAKVIKAMQGDGKLPIIELPVNLDEDIEEIKLPEFKDEKTKAKEYAESISMVADSLGMLNSAAAMMDNEFLSFVTNSFASIAQMIVQLNALTTAKGVASAAELPFPANLAAMATVVSTVASIFGSLPKFADGGVIGGSSFFGDNLIARVNSGEMILNQTQQGKLFSIINNGGSGSNHITVDGEARVSGKTMYIAIRNWMKANNVKW